MTEQRGLSRRDFIKATATGVGTASALGVSSFVLVPQAVAIAPGQTKNYSVWEGREDRHQTSTNGLRTFAVWVSDDKTEVEARWLEEVRGGHQWVERGRARVRGKNRKFLCSVYLQPTENFRLIVKGLRSSPGHSKKCHYWVRCFGDEDYRPNMFTSKNLKDLNTWFAADAYQRWYWGGCTCWLCVNPVDKEILFVDCYVSKATVGANRDYPYHGEERDRVTRLVNLLRHFVAQGYKVTGILASHGHGDHLGDTPYVLGGLRAKGDRNFMNSGIPLSGKGQAEPVRFICSPEALKDPVFGGPGLDDYHKPSGTEVFHPVFGGRTSIDGRPFTAGQPFNVGHFTVQPYIWDHGHTADGGIGARGPRRTLAFRIWRNGGRQPAATFVTTGYIEDGAFMKTITGPIDCHHMLCAWSGDARTADALRRVRLLPGSPVAANWLFAGHGDNNSNALYSTDKARGAILDFFGMLMDRGVIDTSVGEGRPRTRWLGQERVIRLGAYTTRVGIG